jgi:hypothetical protein
MQTALDQNQLSQGAGHFYKRNKIQRLLKLICELWKGLNSFKEVATETLVITVMEKKNPNVLWSFL